METKNIKDIEKMYKITLWDSNIASCCSGTFFFFVEDLAEFEKHWLPLAAVDPSEVERYYRSKSGENVTDYYSDSEELNIVQSASSKIISTRKDVYKNKKITLENGYGFESNYEFDQLIIEQMILQYGKKYYLVAQYDATGCKRCDGTYNRWVGKNTKYAPMNFFGNPVAEYNKRPINWDDYDDPDKYQYFYTDDGDFFKHETLKSFVWLPIKGVRKTYKLKPLTKGEFKILMADIVGDAG